MIKRIAVEYAEGIWNQKNLEFIPKFLDKEIIIHSLHGDFRGQKAMQEVVEAWLHGFPDLEVENERVISEDDTVMIQWKAKGTHLGEFKGNSASGKKIMYGGVTIYRLKNAKIIEYWAYVDLQHLMNQIL
jgi:steroid delta-isomerase-like uncharacterized protein